MAFSGFDVEGLRPRGGERASDAALHRLGTGLVPDITRPNPKMLWGGSVKWDPLLDPQKTTPLL